MIEHELLNITVDIHVTFPSYLTITLVEMLDILAHESALFAVKIKILLRIEINQINQKKQIFT